MMVALKVLGMVLVLLASMGSLAVVAIGHAIQRRRRIEHAARMKKIVDRTVVLEAETIVAQELLRLMKTGDAA